MSIAFVQSSPNGAAGNGGTGTIAVTLPSNVGAGHQLIAFITTKGVTTTPSVSSLSGGGTPWVQEGWVNTGFATTEDVEVWMLASATGGATTVTANLSDGGGGYASTGQALWVSEWSGISGIYGVNSIIGSSVTPTGPSMTPTGAGQLYICMACMSNVPSASPGGAWNILTGPQTYNSNINPIAYQIGGAGALQPAWTQTTGYWASQGAIFTPTTAGIALAQAGWDSGNSGNPIASGTGFSTATSNITSGNVVVVGIYSLSSTTVSSIATNFGGTATAVPNTKVAYSTGFFELWVITGTTGGGKTITPTLSGAQSYFAIAFEYSGCGGATGGQHASGTSTSPSVALTGVVSGDAVLAIANGPSLFSAAPGGWTIYNTGSFWLESNAADAAWILAPGAGTQTATWTQSSAAWSTLGCILVPHGVSVGAGVPQHPYRSPHRMIGHRAIGGTY